MEEIVKASVFHSKGNVKVEVVALDDPQPDEVIVDVHYCGVCGTDVHIFGGLPGSASVSPPIILGHEISGTVAAVGKAVPDLSVGSLVTVNPNDMCGRCFYCRQGKSAFCLNHRAVGTTINGGFAEKIAIRAKQVYVLDRTDPAEAALIEPLSCCVNAFREMTPGLGDSYLIVGGGTIGLMMVQLARLSGAATVLVAELIDEKRQLATATGADGAFNPSEIDLPSVMDAHGIRDFDKVIECVGLPQTQAYALEVIGKGTEVMLFGLGDPDATVPVPPYNLFRNQAKILTSFINPDTYQQTVSLVESQRLDLKTLIAGTISLQEVGDVLADAGRRAGGKILVAPQAT